MVTLSCGCARFRARRWRFVVTPCTIAGVPADDDLVAHLVRTTPLTPSEAVRVVAEVVAYYGEGVPDYVRRRHAELNRPGLTNDLIFDEIAAELVSRRFAAPDMSVRQLRRLVYG
jgi:hypothetical protein